MFRAFWPAVAVDTDERGLCFVWVVRIDDCDWQFDVIGGLLRVLGSGFVVY